MRFLADECCDSAVVMALREAGHDVLSVGACIQGAEDTHVIELALREQRILLTEDKDFGRLVYAHGRRTLGVIFLRYPIFARQQISRDVVELIRRRGESISGCFVTVQTGKIRISHVPGE
jgi:predicted nuclease of predicted toxin-antitoxin system